MQQCFEGGGGLLFARYTEIKIIAFVPSFSYSTDHGYHGDVNLLSVAMNQSLIHSLAHPN